MHVYTCACMYTHVYRCISMCACMYILVQTCSVKPPLSGLPRCGYLLRRAASFNNKINNVCMARICTVPSNSGRWTSNQTAAVIHNVREECSKKAVRRVVTLEKKLEVLVCLNKGKSHGRNPVSQAFSADESELW